MSSSVVDQFDTEMRIAALPCQRRAADPARPVRLHAAMTASRDVASSAPKRTQHLVQHDVVHDLDPGRRPQPSANRRARAQHRSTSSATPRGPSDAQRGVDREPARAARRLGHPVERVAALALARSEVRRRVMPIARGARRGSRDERDAAVVRHVEPLVRVGRPRVGVARRPPTSAARRRRPRPTVRRRRRRAPRRRARARRRSRSAADRTRRCSRCPPARNDRRAVAAPAPASASARIAPLVVGRRRRDLRVPNPSMRSARQS